MNFSKYSKYKDKQNKAKDKKFPVKVLALVLALFMVLIASLFVVDSFAPANPKCYHKFILSTFNGSYDKEGMPKSAFEVKNETDAESGESLYTCVNMKVSIPNDKTGFKEAWINISDLQASKLEVFTAYGIQRQGKAKLKGERTITAQQLKASKDGWFKIYSTDTPESWNSGADWTKIGFSAPVKVREIVFVYFDEKDATEKLCSITVEGYSIGGKPNYDEDRSTDKYQETWLLENMPANDPYAGIANVTGEGGTFPYLN